MLGSNGVAFLEFDTLVVVAMSGLRMKPDTYINDFPRENPLIFWDVKFGPVGPDWDVYHL
jgi:hypothetical protein